MSGCILTVTTNFTVGSMQIPPDTALLAALAAFELFLLSQAIIQPASAASCEISSTNCKFASRQGGSSARSTFRFRANAAQNASRLYSYAFWHHELSHSAMLFSLIIFYISIYTYNYIYICIIFFSLSRRSRAIFPLYPTN